MSLFQSLIQSPQRQTRYSLVMNTRVKEIAMTVEKDKFNPKTYRELWFKDGNLTNCAFESFPQEQQRQLIENMKKELASTCCLRFYQKSRMKTCLEITEMMLTVSRDMRRNELKQKQKKAEMQVLRITRSHRPIKGFKHRSTQTDPEITHYKSNLEQFAIEHPENYLQEMNDEMAQFLRRKDD